MKGIMPSAGLVAFLCWPFLAAWLLWASRRVARPLDLALAGIMLTLAGVLFCPYRLDLGEKIFLVVEGTVPALFFLITCKKVRTQCLNGTVMERMPFLVTGCALMGLCLHPVLAVMVFLGVGSVMLAWWDGLTVRRALAAWKMVRLRLCGVLVGALGAVLFQGISVQGAEATGSIVGSVLLVCGLGALAGLGSPTTPPPGLALLDVGLRFAALVLMARLYMWDMACPVMIAAALAGLVMATVGRSRSQSFLPFIVALAVLAAAYGQVAALLMLFVVALLEEGLRLSLTAGPTSPETLSLVVKAAAPVIGVVMVMLGRVMAWEVVVIMLICATLVLGFLHCPDRTPEGVAVRPLAFWERNESVAQGLVLLLMVLALVGVGMMAWHPVLAWHP